MKSLSVRLLDPRLPEWGFPRWGSAGSAGLDLHACIEGPLAIAPQAPPMLVPAGIVVMIGDPDWCGLVFARSGLGHREGLVLGNGTGVIDSDYAGPLMVSLWNRNPAVTDAGIAGPAITIEPGDRIAQLAFVRVCRPEIEIVERSDPDRTGRGEGGFGSTGRR